MLTNITNRFLWVEFQLDAICAELSDKGIEKALARVPEDMSATYERILETINKKPRAHRELARRVLIWTAYARRPLSIEKLAYAISIERDTTSLEDLKSSIPTEKSILSACANLISVDQSNFKYDQINFKYSNVRFVHFSVQEFLTSHQSKYIETLDMGPEAAHREIAQSCITSLMLFPSNKGILGSYQYAHDEWQNHLLAGNLNNLRLDDPIVTLTLSFFDTGPVVLRTRHSAKRRFTFSPPVLRLIFDLPGTQKHRKPHGQLAERQSFDLNCELLDDELSMHYAIKLDSVPAAQRLYNYGYPIDYSYCGDNRNVPNWLQKPPLYSVRSTQMARFLLSDSITINIKPPPQYHDAKEFDNLLEHFVGKGYSGVEVVRFLLRKLGDPDQNEERLRRTLQVAVLKDNVEVTRLLLDKGIDVNIQGKKNGSLLVNAVLKGNKGVIQLLLDKGADINIRSGPYDNALQAAVWKDKKRVIQLLLDKGADVNIQGGDYGSALQAAVLKAGIKVVRLLLDTGADVNIQGGLYGSALRAAVLKGDIKVIQLLLDKGADVNIHGGQYGSALQAAVLKGDIKVIQLLLDKGADVNIHGGQYGSALQAAGLKGDIKVIQLLLDKGADVNVQGGWYGSALQAAISEDNIEVIQLLLDNGADVNIQGGEFGTAFQTALAPGFTYRNVKQIFTVVELLLDHGADVMTYVPGSKYGNALTAAKHLWRGDRYSFDAFKKILASRGWEGDGAESDEAEVWTDEAVTGRDKAEAWSDKAEAGIDTTEAWSDKAESWSDTTDSCSYIAEAWSDEEERDEGERGEGGGDEGESDKAEIDKAESEAEDALKVSRKSKDATTPDGGMEELEISNASAFKSSKKNMFGVLGNLWKLFGLTFLVFLLYVLVELVEFWS